VLHIDGVIEGTVESTSDVTIGSSGRFEGNLRARHILVSGYLRGKVDCDRLEIVADGKVFGEVTSQQLVIEAGGQFAGESQVKGMVAAPALDHQPVAAEQLLDPSALERV